MAALIECVPNFSEGRDPEVIRRITAEIEGVEGVNLLDVDPGRATNRTVVTFVGPPERVLEAAVRAGKAAAALIDMAGHRGEHPRFGAMDVCPLVPVSGITMAETAEWARRLGRRLADEAGLTIYLYEHAATRPERHNLADVRAGQYEGLEKRLADPRWAPDFGPAVFNRRAGATAVGARAFLVAYNVNLNTTSTRRANAVAFDVREQGRILQDPPLTGRVVHDEKGQPLRLPGSLEGVKAIGWFIEEYGIAQISMNITNLSVTPLHEAFDEVCRKAAVRGLRVTGSELVGLVPLEAVLDAGRHFLRKQHRSLGVSDSELIKIAVRSMGLDELSPFAPDKKIIEYAIRDATRKRLVDLGVQAFVEETASESPAPGGGSVSAAVGALGAALGTMVANLSSHKRGWDERWEEFSEVAEAGKACQEALLGLVDADTEAFQAIVAAWRSDAEGRTDRIQEATKQAIEVPMRVMETAIRVFDVLEDMEASGMQASLSDVGVGALCVRTAVLGADLNVRINAKALKDEKARAAWLHQAAELRLEALRREQALLERVYGKLAR